MAKRQRQKVSAKGWADTPDSGFVMTCLKLPDGIELFTPKKEGIYRLDVIPYEVPKTCLAGPNPNAHPGELHYERTYFIHRGIGVDEKNYVCPNKTAGKPCPICEYRREQMQSRNGDEDVVKALSPKQRQLWNVIDREEDDETIRVWDISFHNFGKQLKREIRDADEDDGYEYFADPEDGLTLRVGLDETSFAGSKPFLQAGTINFKVRKNSLSDEIMDAAQPLDSLLTVLDYDKLKSIFLQEEGVVDDKDDKEDEDDEPEEKPKKRTQRKKKEEPKEELTTADDAGISKGDDVLYEGGICTVIKVSGDGTSLTLMDSDDELIRAVSPGDVKPAEEQEKPKTKKSSTKKKDSDSEQDAEPSKGKSSMKKDKEEESKDDSSDEDSDWDDDEDWD